jgi:phospholipid/cholesterol/gamma-HCH transport system substrate-binding protein
MTHSNRAQEIRVGIMSILAVIALVAGIIWGKGIGFNPSQQIVRMSFPDATGLEAGAAVTLNGVRKGSVTSVETDGSVVLIKAVVEPDVSLRRDATARIEIAEITGGKRIALVPGTSDAPFPVGSTIAGTVGPDPASLLNDVGAAGAEARVAVRRLDTSLAALNAIVTDPSFRRRVENTLLNLEDASGAARGIAVENRAVIERSLHNVDAAASELRSLVVRSGPGVDRTLLAAERATIDIRTAIGSAEVAIASADTLLKRLDSLAVDLRYGAGTTAMLLYDSTFAHELRETVFATRALIEETRRKGLNLNIGLGTR